MTTNNIYWTLKVAINDGKKDEVKALASEMTEATQSGEPGALNYEWHFCSDGKSCHIYERYADNAAVMAHLGNFGEKFADRFMGVFTPVSFDVYGPADETVRGALAQMGAKHHEQFNGFTR